MLGQADVRSFERDGCCRLRSAVPAALLAEAQSKVWKALEAEHGIKDVGGTWDRPSYRLDSLDFLSATLGGERLPDVVMHSIGLLCGGLGRVDLASPGRFNNLIVRRRPSAATIASSPWLALPLPPALSPAPCSWHIDGWASPRHLHSPEVGLVCLWLLSDIAPRAGGTVVAPDSIGARAI